MIKFLKTLFTVSLFVSLSSISLAQNQVNDGTDDPDYDFLTDAEMEAEGVTTLDEGFFAKTANFISSRVRKGKHSTSFGQAKVRMYKSLYDNNTFYCGCDTDLPNKTFHKNSCGYVARSSYNRSKRTEAEHVLPASRIAEYKPNTTCWVKHPSCGDARDCCMKNDAVFKKAHNDLVNLVPAIGELNHHRLHHPFDIIPGEKREYGQCDFEKTSRPSLIEPREEVRGDIARIYFYMRSEYGLVYPQTIENKLNQWNVDDPVSTEEKRRNVRIKRIQGSANPIIK